MCLHNFYRKFYWLINHIFYSLSLSLYLVLTGDQGFLNSYYTGFPNAHVFEPNLPIDSRSVPEMQRLSTLYNADVGLYMLANKVLTMMYGY